MSTTKTKKEKYIPLLEREKVLYDYMGNALYSGIEFNNSVLIWSQNEFDIKNRPHVPYMDLVTYK